MHKRNLLNIALLLFVVVLITLAALEPGKKAITSPPLLTDLKASEITHIKLKRNYDKTTIELIKKENRWVMLSPYQLAANEFRIDSLLKLLSAVSFSKNDLSKLNPSEFGLEQPLASITFNNSTSIIFGHNQSLKHHRYIKIGSELHMIADTFYYQLAANAESFISHKVLPDNIDITELRLPSLTLKKVNNRWQVTPAMTSFSADAANALIQEWQLSQAYDIKIKKIPATTRSDIEITSLNYKTLRFTLNDAMNNFSITNIDSGISYILSSDKKDMLLQLSSPDDSHLSNDNEK